MPNGAPKNNIVPDRELFKRQPRPVSKKRFWIGIALMVFSAIIFCCLEWIDWSKSPNESLDEFYRLVVSYWVNLFLGTILLFLIGLGLLGSDEDTSTDFFKINILGFNKNSNKEK